MSYKKFAYVYDDLMYDIDYTAWVCYLEKIFQRFGSNPEVILDLGCGTGSTLIEFINQGKRAIGIDSSADMLAVAQNKLIEKNIQAQLIHQDMTDFLYDEPVDVCVSLLDSINHVTDKKALQRMFSKIHLTLKPNGMFVFDINTLFKIEHTMGNNVFYQVDDDCSYIWQCNYNKRKQLNRFDLTFFQRVGDLYEKWEEITYERAYTEEEIIQLLKSANFEVLAVFNEFSFESPKPNSERLFFVARKKE